MIAVLHRQVQKIVEEELMSQLPGQALPHTQTKRTDYTEISCISIHAKILKFTSDS